MRCSTCRDSFSEAFDARLSAGDAAAFDGHVRACSTCASDYASYRRVFDAVRSVGAVRPAPAFRRPAELPGARAAAVAASGFAPSTRHFRRVAAAVLIAAGLGLSHGVVFRYGRDVSAVSDVERPEGHAVSPTLANAMSFARLRDHVEATDLFMRTAAQMPPEAGARGRDLIRADFARLDLGAFADELRESDVVRDDEHGATFRNYLANVAAMCGRLNSVFEDGAGDLEKVRDVVLASPVTRDVAFLRPVVSPLGGGRTFANRKLANIRLAKDEKTLFESRDARLSGDFSNAVGGFERFESEFRASRLKPLADYLLAETYARSGNYTPAIPLLARIEQSGGMFLPNDNLAPLVVVFGDERVLDRREVRVNRVAPSVTLHFERTGPTGPERFVPDVYTWRAPDNAVEYLKARGLSMRCTLDAWRRPVFEILREDGTPLLVKEYSRLFSNVLTLIGRPGYDGALLGPTEIDERSASNKTPTPPAPRKPVVR